MKDIKAIVLDVDGTLMTSTKTISDKTRNALIKVQEQGVKVILASGRPTPGMTGLAHTLNMDQHHGFLISYNGACVTDCQSHEMIYEQPIHPDVYERLCKHLQSFDVIPMIAHDAYMYVNDVFNGMIYVNPNPAPKDALFNVIQYESRGGGFLLSELDDLSTLKEHPIFKVLIAAHPDTLQETYKDIMAPFIDVTNSAFSAPFYYEFTDKGVDKAATIQRLMEPLGYEASNIMAFGDGHNDQSMLEYAGIGVAMGNAVDEVKAIADEITLSNDEDGIALSLYKQFPDIFA
ncbi:HAD family hydrolase [Erysipelothrix larvae]|uniref:HAD family hydrolase n=1 Tax=Erysipelothrix larvae TaxID=1514105 RepID=A0A109UH56_9FIRM|nr:Cof-type HAD-IIB family hydrolase [Erysipelothrix larvae]AMC93618.1 HAD family hydrolase [Erysipelothrix larvae]